MGIENSNQGIKLTDINDVKKNIETEQIKIIQRQSKNNICKILSNKGILKGNGFLCYIPYTVLIATNKTLNKEDLYLNNEIYIIFNNNEILKKIQFTNNRNFITIENDVTIIEIFPEKDGITENDFLEINDEEDDETKYINEDVYLKLYGQNIKKNFLFGKIIELIKSDNNSYDIYHNCLPYDNDLIGCPLILFNNKVIGIQNTCNKATSLKQSITEYNKKFNKNKNHLLLTLKIGKNDINKKIFFIDNTERNYYENGKEISHYHDNLKELSEKNTIIYINNKRQKLFKKYFIPEYQGVYFIKIIFTEKLTNCSYLFTGCDNIIDIDFSSFITHNVINMGYMFACCKNLTNIDLSYFNTKNVINMERMFNDCGNLTEIDLSSFNTQKVTNMEWMFANCNNLVNIDLTSFNTKNVVKMENLFYGCRNLIKVNLSSFNIKKASDISAMFFGCNKIISIDLSTFNLKNGINMKYMFDECYCLKSIKVNKYSYKKIKENIPISLNIIIV